MAFLRSRGIPVPAIYGYSSTANNPSETEYILMEYSPGRNLASVWADMNEHQQARFVKSLVDIERRLFGIKLPASGSLYFRQDTAAPCAKMAVDSSVSESSFYVGPATSPPL